MGVTLIIVGYQILYFLNYTRTSIAAWHADINTYALQALHDICTGDVR